MTRDCTELLYRVHLATVALLAPPSGSPAQGRDTARGGYDTTLGGYDSARGGHDTARGGYDAAPGGHDTARGGYDREGYDTARGGYATTRDGYNTARGGYDSTLEDHNTARRVLDTAGGGSPGARLLAAAEEFAQGTVRAGALLRSLGHEEMEWAVRQCIQVHKY